MFISIQNYYYNEICSLPWKYHDENVFEIILSFITDLHYKEIREKWWNIINYRIKNEYIVFENNTHLSFKQKRYLQSYIGITQHFKSISSTVRIYDDPDNKFMLVTVLRCNDFKFIRFFPNGIYMDDILIDLYA